MSEIKSESISSLVDNYLPSTDDSVSAHLVENLLKDEYLASTWQNYHLIGDVLRDEVPHSLQLDLSTTISAAIAQEATILSPNLASQTLNQTNDLPVEQTAVVQQTPTLKNTNNVVNATHRFKAKIASLVKPLVKPMGQVAIAASAAALMIVGVQQNVSDSLSPVTPSQVVQTMPLAGYANPVSFNVTPQTNNSQSNSQTQQALDNKIAAERVAQQRRLHALLQDHNQQVKIGNNIK